MSAFVPDSDPVESASSKSDAARLTRMGTVFYVGMVAVAVVWREGFQGQSILFASEVDRLDGLNWVRDGLIGVVLGLCVVMCSNVLTRSTRWGEVLARQLSGVVGSLTFPQCLWLACASGLGEELLFRGALQPVVGLVWASLCFGLIHMGPRLEWLPWTAFALVMGVILGSLYIWTGNLVAPVVAHTVINGVNLPLLARRYRMSPVA